MSTATTFNKSCDRCRARKIRCDRTCPCSRCAVFQRQCTYLDVPQNKGRPSRRTSANDEYPPDNIRSYAVIRPLEAPRKSDEDARQNTIASSTAISKVADQNNETGHVVASHAYQTMTPDMSHQTPAIPPHTPTKPPEDVSYVNKIELRFEDFPECGTSNEPNTIYATGHHVATNSITPNPLESDAGTPEFVKDVHQLSLANAGLSVDTVLHDHEDASVSVPATLDYDTARDGVIKYQNDVKAALSIEQYKRFIDLVTDCKTKSIWFLEFNTRATDIFFGHPKLKASFDMISPPENLANYMSLCVQPPQLTRRRVALYPPLMVRVLNATMDLNTVSTFARLYRDDGKDVTKLLEGSHLGLYVNGDFRFSNLKITDEGRYRIQISLWHLDEFVGVVDSHIISVGDRPLLNETQEIQYAKRQLHMQDIDDNVKDDPTQLFPNWKYKIHIIESIIAVGQTRFTKTMVLIPGSAFKREKFDNRLYQVLPGGLGERLFTDESGMWYDDGEVERATKNQDSLIHLGTDGELYRREPVFNGQFVALERRVAWTGGLLCVAHIVLS